ncbi:MAG TPA: alpha/beta hydrolase domain-containing protein [Candidatus Sulfotelmatobacter sp.]|nr:alpha/beta hydrolase domain-containing protein [Candidatus Sulfotelmatobacter sp.]
MRLAVLVVVLWTGLWAGLAHAAVERIEITERHLLADGKHFGKAGAYEKLRGRAWFALDPKSAANAAIADLKLAPRDGRGLVVFDAEFVMLRPVDGARANGTLLYDVPNRGNLAMLRQLDEAPDTNDPSSEADLGNAFLLQQGFTMLWSAWQWDISAPAKERRLILKPPIATENGKPITGKVAFEFLVNAPAATAEFTGNAGLAYPFARAGTPDAELTRRERPDGKRQTIPRTHWGFVAPADGGLPSQLRLDDGFEPGHLYELVYTARDPVVVAAGLAGIRDLLSYVRANPLENGPLPKRTLIFGISQSGRVIQTMLLHGLHVDEAGKPVFDGAFIHVAGGGKGGFDYRFALPTRHFSMLEDHDYPTDYFPFTTTPEHDPVTGAHGSVLDKARALDVVPKLFYVNQSTEYWNRSASLTHTDPEGEHDVAVDPRARVYLIAGAQHFAGRQRNRGIYANCVNPMDHYREMRALLLALDRWVRDGTEPPASLYPRLADGTLVTVAAYKAAFPKLDDVALPETNLRPPRLDLGPRFESQHIADFVPPHAGKPFETRVPRPDADGNDRGGIVPPELAVPLGTRAAFNTRTAAAGFPWATARFDGSFIPFARSEAERRFANDPRPSLEARYADRADYEKQLRAAAERTVAAGFLRPEEVDDLVAEGGAFYDRIMAHDPADRSCTYLFGP